MNPSELLDAKKKIANEYKEKVFSQVELKIYLNIILMILFIQGNAFFQKGQYNEV